MRIGGIDIFLLLFVFFVVLSGKITAEIAAFGAFVSALVFVFMYKYLGWTLRHERNFYILIPFGIAYLCVLFVEILKSAIAVLPYIWGGKKPDGVVISFDSGLRSSLSNAVLSNSITMTPGTITLEQNGDHLVVHCLHWDLSDGIDESVFIKLLSKMEKCCCGGGK